MRPLLRASALLVVLVVVVLGGVYLWASSVTNRTYGRAAEVHTVGFPIPFPLDDGEVEELGLAEEEAAALAMERARERGEHLVSARYGCAECHGADFGGGVMIDTPPIGRLLGPNLTPGRGGVTSGYDAADWDRIVRHGVNTEGHPTAMPSEDFQRMSDQELSDIAVYLGTVTAVDNAVPAVRIGPVGKFLVATGRIMPAYDRIAAHDEPHRVRPPEAAPTAEFGRHLVAVCTGCHGQELAGGPVPGGDPSWPPARNLTPHEDGLGGWSYVQFAEAMRSAARPDGTPIRSPMAEVAAYAQRMSDVELEAMWAYLRSLPARPSSP